MITANFNNPCLDEYIHILYEELGGYSKFVTAGYRITLTITRTTSAHIPAAAINHSN